MKQYKIENNYIPVKGFKMLTFYNIVFVRKGSKVDEKDLNHEKIHTVQQYTTLIATLVLLLLVDSFARVPFWMYIASPLVWFILYGLWWIAELYINPGREYRSIPYEVEAYANQDNLDYLKTRKPWDIYKYIKKTK